MELFNADGVEREFTISAESRATVEESSTPERLEMLLEALGPPGSVALLIGEAGTGKNRLAQEAAGALAGRLGEPVSVIALEPPPSPLTGIATHFGFHFPELFGASDALENSDHFNIEEPEVLAARLIEAVERDSENGTPLLIAQGLDQYSPMASMMLDRLVRSHRIRVVGTTRQLSGAAGQLARDPQVRKISVPPLSVAEAQRFIVQLLGAEYVELQTLRRWYRVTEGNSLSLTLLALTLDRRGLVGRKRGVVYELPGAEAVPTEFREFLHSTCTAAELRTLELVAHVEPMFENAFIQLLDPVHVAHLTEQGLLVAGTGPSGRLTLSLKHQLLTKAVREQMTPARLVEVSNQLFDALHDELGSEDPYRSPRLLFRMVAMGLDADRSVPLGWLWEALEILRSGHELQLRLRVALAVAAHPDASTLQLTIGAQQASQIARFIGDRARLAEALDHVRTAVERTRRVSGVPALLRAKLRLALVEHLTLDREDAEGAEALLDELEREFAEADARVVEIVRNARVLFLGRSGRLREAAELVPDPGRFGTMPIEWERTFGRAISSLILAQRGRQEDAVQVAEYAESFASLGEQPQIDSADLLRFCGFIGAWGCGALESARQMLGEAVRQSFSDVHYSGLVDTCAVLMSLSDGKWRLAAQRAERLRERLAAYDRHGVAALVNAALSLALAALGEHAASRRAIRLAESRHSGISQAVTGYLRLLTLQARQWNGDEEKAELALRLASWARTQQLEAIELRALRLLAVEDRAEAAPYRGRIEALAASMDPPFGEALLAHCEELLDGRDGWDTPASRRLTEYGIWMPLPLTEELSSREREIALFASLGYSSRWIAEQFHLSVRTVDTHLRHVFTKLRVSGRDELRQWFRREHVSR
ncbi:LuxR C-terminal-related transcriptional regulator [Leucobacter sp. UCD-THU]|jgi:DNA-binding CsgD family transcriptional regulator|uniref:LuxR C-terminal-related transcriptional regulator n=1 Tax=Leucobacter sp. UCD-THU TaxID=1292023 RepID=UPI0009DB63FE|nr:LuxR C-terminal-related transcriptional regulator [Leucobacter sp. UCD-THU]